MKVLVVIIPGKGHLDPIIPLCKNLIDNGDEVVLCTSNAFKSSIENKGIRYNPVGGSVCLDKIEYVLPEVKGLNQEEQNLVIMQKFFLDLWPMQVYPELIKFTESYKPDLIIRDYCECSSLLVSVKLNIPCICCNIAISFNRIMIKALFGRSMLKLCNQFNISTENNYGFEKNLYINYFPKEWNLLQRAGNLKRLLSAGIYGPNRIKRFAGFIMYSFMKVVTLLPENNLVKPIHVRPDTFHDVLPVEDPLFTFPKNKWPNVLVYFGTLAGNSHPEIFKKIVDDFTGKEVNVLVIIGSKTYDLTQHNNLPDNILIKLFVELETLYDIALKSDVIICHAATSSINFASFGIPLILLPMCSDGPMIAEILESHGVGIMPPIKNIWYGDKIYCPPFVNIESFKPGDIYKLYLKITDNVKYKTAANKFKNKVQALPAINEIGPQINRFAKGKPLYT